MPRTGQTDPPVDPPIKLGEEDDSGEKMRPRPVTGISG
jgi:hypothetical protein